MQEKNYKFRGRYFSTKEIKTINDIINANPNITRRKLSAIICEQLNWRQPNGILKDRACRDVLLRMHAKGLVNCPPIRLKRRRKNQGNAKKDKVKFIEPKEILTGKVGEYKELKFEMVKQTSKEGLWDYLIDKYHYLGYQIIVGHHLKYLIYLDNNLVGCIGFNDGILKFNLRDKWIGWTNTQREKNLHLIINNNRYLILPWIKIKYLSSKILSKISKYVMKSWKSYYGYEPLLLETFVDIEKFKGTSYKAANWKYLGQTKGKGRTGMDYFYHGKIKDAYVYELKKNTRKELLENKKC